MLSKSKNKRTRALAAEKKAMDWKYERELTEKLRFALENVEGAKRMKLYASERAWNAVVCGIRGKLAKLRGGAWDV